MQGGTAMFGDPLPSPPSIIVDRFEDRRTGRREVKAEITDDYYVAVLSTRRCRIDIFCNGRPFQNGVVVPGMMRLAAPGERLDMVIHDPCEALTIRIPGPTLRAKVEAIKRDHRQGAASYMDPLPQPNSQVAQLAHVLQHREDFGPAHSALFVEGLTQALLTYLLHHHGWTLRVPLAAEKRLTPAELRRAVAFADARMLEALTTGVALTLESWATDLRMPVAEFRQRFHATTGHLPYAWYLQRRIAFAKERLTHSEEPLSEIALRVGFSSQSHFTEAFRRLEGVPPARWRAQGPGRIS